MEWTRNKLFIQIYTSALTSARRSGELRPGPREVIGVIGVRFLVLVWVCTVLAIPVSAQPGADSPEKRQIDFALGLFKRGEYGSAAAEFKVYLKDPAWKGSRPVAAFFLGESHRILNQPDEAILAYRALLDTGATGEYRTKGSYRLGALLVDRGKAAEAIPVLEPLSQPDIPAEFREGALYTLGVAFSQSERRPEAIATWARFREEFPESPFAGKALLGEAFEEVKLERWDRAIPLLEQWLEGKNPTSDPGYLPALSDLARSLEKSGKKRDAIPRYLQLAEQATESDVRDRAFLSAAQLAFDQADWGTLDSLAPRFRKDVKSPAVQLNAFLLEGNRFFREQSWVKARERFSEALPLAAQPELESVSGGLKLETRIRLRMAWCSHASQTWKEIQETLEPVMAKGFVPEEASFLAAEAARGLEQWNEAADLYAKVTGATDLRTRALSGEADSAFRGEQWDRASALYQEILRSKPAGPTRVLTLSRIGDSERALQRWSAGAVHYASASVEASTPEIQDRALYLAGWCAYRAKDFATAVNLLTRATETFPKSNNRAESLYLLGQSLGEVGNTDAQIGALESLSREFTGTDWNADGLIRLAAAYSKKGDRVGVLSVLRRFQRTFSERPLHRDFALWLAEAQVQSGSPEEALATIDPLLAGAELSDLERENLLTLKARSHQSLKQWGQAYTSYTESVERFPTGPKSLPNRVGGGVSALHDARLEDASKAWAGAFADLRARNVSNPSIEAELYLLQGDIEFGQGDFDEAYRAYARTSILYFHPEHTPRALFMSAVCKERLGDDQTATELRAQLSRDYPEFNAAKVDLFPAGVVESQP